MPNKKSIINDLCHYGDILAIPFFAWLSIYFYNIENKSIVEYILFLFSIGGFIMDLIYTFIYCFPIFFNRL